MRANTHVRGGEGLLGFSPDRFSGKGRGPHVVNANSADGDTEVMVPQTTNRENAAAIVTPRSATGDVIIDDLR
jgi:hypothetical protein